MDELKKAICKIAEEYKLNCVDEELDYTVIIFSAIITAHSEILKVLEGEHIEIDHVIRKEYILLLYTIAMKYLPEVSRECRMLILSSLRAAYSEELQDTNEIQKYYLETKDTMDEIEEEMGSPGAVTYSLICSDEKFFENDIIERIIKGQVEAVVHYLLDGMKDFGLLGWRDEGTKTKSEDNKSEGNNKPLESVKRKRTPLEAFRDSAKLCAIRSKVIKRISSLNYRLDTHYDEHAEYRESFNRNLVPVGERIYWFMIIGTAIVVLGSLFHAESQAFFLLLLLVMAFFLLRQWDRKEADRTASEIAEKTRNLRIEQEEHRTEWTEERNKFVQIQNDITKGLYELVQIGGVPETYWEVAGLLWEYVEQKRADSFKEAVNLYHNDMRWKETERKYQELQNQNTRLYQEINELWNSQRELSDEIDVLNSLLDPLNPLSPYSIYY